MFLGNKVKLSRDMRFTWHIDFRDRSVILTKTWIYKILIVSKGSRLYKENKDEKLVKGFLERMLKQFNEGTGTNTKQNHNDKRKFEVLGKRRFEVLGKRRFEAFGK